MEWPLGEYISNLLHQRGGRLAGWTQSRLAKMSGLSATEISWIIRGEASGKKGTPNITVDTLLALSRALNVPDTALLAAYKGENPDIALAKWEEESKVIRAAVSTVIGQLPMQTIADCFSSPERLYEFKKLITETQEGYEEKLFEFLMERKQNQEKGIDDL